MNIKWKTWSDDIIEFSYMTFEASMITHRSDMGEIESYEVSGDYIFDRLKDNIEFERTFKSKEKALEYTEKKFQEYLVKMDKGIQKYLGKYRVYTW